MLEDGRVEREVSSELSEWIYIYIYVCGEYDEKSGVVSDDEKEKRE